MGIAIFVKKTFKIDEKYIFYIILLVKTSMFNLILQSTPIGQIGYRDDTRQWSFYFFV